MNAAPVTVARFQLPWRAELCQQFLAAEGIWSFLADRELTALNGFLGVAAGGVRLQVRAHEARRAWDFLVEREIQDRVSRRSLDQAQEDTPVEEQQRTEPAHEALCPDCAAGDLETVSPGLLSALLGARPRTRCLDCGYDWYPD